MRDYGLHRKKAKFAEDHETDLLQSFHPSIAINNTDCRPEYRALLMHHFVAAFSVLNDKFAFPDSVEEIRKLCLRKGNRVENTIPRLDDWEAADFISRALKEKYEDAQIEPDYIGFVGNTKDEMESFDNMYTCFERLLGSKTNTFGTLGIAIVITFYWKEYFRFNPIYRQLRQWLLIRGNEQEDWFPSPGHYQTLNTHNTLKSDEIASLEHSLSTVNITTPSDQNLREVMSINNEVTQLASAFLGLSRSGLALDPFPKDKLRTLVITHNSYISGYLRLSPSTNINNTLRIGALTQRCEFLVIILADSLADSRAEHERALEELLGCVKQLHMIFECLFA